MKKNLIILILLLTGFSSFAQLSMGGRPTGFKFGGKWANVPLYSMPPVDVAALLAEDAVPDPEMKKPIRFGKASAISIIPSPATGLWETLPNGNRLWRQRMKSAGAYSLSFGFRNMNMPAGSKLFIYNADRTIVLGAFTAELTYTDDILATEQVNGDEAMIEYEVPAGSAAVAPFELYRISHDYRDINKLLKAFGNAGSCQVNINCPAGANYQTVKKGVAAIISSGSDLCTGTLVNTTNNSGTPYFLTANHCYDNMTANWVFRFNWESLTCANPATNPSFQSISGATLKAKNGATDFCLVQLSTTPPASYQTVFVGWDKSGAIPTSEACISHPSIDIKKICTAAGPATSSTYNGATTWQSGTWSNGCTEPGSSGSALLDQNKRIVGQLFGGPSACGQPPANMYDQYGKFSLSWTGGGTSATRLKDWLDPTNINIDTVNLYDPNVPTMPYDAMLVSINNPSPQLNCNSTITPGVTIMNRGSVTLTALTISYTVDRGTPANYNWTGSLASNASAAITLPSFVSPLAGSHTFRSYVSQPNGQPDGNHANDTLSVVYSISNANPVSLPLSESFESSAFPPNGWTLNNPDGLSSWARFTVGYTGFYSASKDNYTVDDHGQEDYLTTPFLNFSSPSATYKLSFRVAYAQYDAGSHDSLKVVVSADCGATWTNVYAKGGAVLATAPNNTSPFMPASTAQWRKDSVMLNQYRNTSSLQVRFISKSDFGNNLYLDDVNIDTSATDIFPAFIAQPDTICAGQTINLINSTTGATSYRWNMPGGTPSSSTMSAPTVSYNAAGTYTITLTAFKGADSAAISHDVYVNALPTPRVQRNGLVLVVARAYASYQWYKDGIIVNGETGQTLNPPANGSYYVIVKDSSGCYGQSTATTISGVGINDLTGGNELTIMPNPAHDMVELKQAIPGSAPLEVRISNMLGQEAARYHFGNEPSVWLDIHALAPGIYTIHIAKGSVITTRRLTVR